MSLAEAVAAGRLEGLRALRDRLAAEIEGGGEKRDLAALARQLRETLKEIAELEKAAPKGSKVDELRDRRARRASSSGARKATGARKAPAKRQRSGGGRARS